MQEIFSTITSKGQVTIPVAVRRHLGVSTHDKVAFVIDGDQVRVTFVGAVSHDVLPLYYNAADVCAIPSYYESFGLVAIEAMACGTPVVATRVGGLISTIRDGETGYLIPWRCPEPHSSGERVKPSSSPVPVSWPSTVVELATKNIPTAPAAISGPSSAIAAPPAAFLPPPALLATG